jgi:hypothetical protein
VNATAANAAQLVQGPDGIRNVLQDLATDHLPYRTVQERQPLNISPDRGVSVMADLPRTYFEEVHANTVFDTEKGQKAPVGSSRV